MGLKKIGAAWIKQGKNGNFLSAQVMLGGKKINLLIFKNTNKESGQDKYPDYEILLPDEIGGER